MSKISTFLLLLILSSHILFSQNDFKAFIVIANGSGVLRTPNMATFAFNDSGFPLYNGLDRPQTGQQSTNTSLWGIHTGSVSPGMDYRYYYFKYRVTRDGANWPMICPFNYEIRFTTAGSQAKMLLTSENIFKVPFEIWNIGSAIPNDPTDDYKLVASIYEKNPDGVFDLEKIDHGISGGDNDPETDWIYIYDVTDHTPGTSGYDAVVASRFANGIGNEVMARIVFVNFNGGSVSDPNWPNNLNATLPENGTVFRIETMNPATDILNDVAISSNYRLLQNYPNPFNPTTTIKYSIPQSQFVNLKIYDLLGREIDTLINEEINAGTYEVKFDGSSLTSGIYLCRLKAGNYSETKKLILMK